jgi:hypothetical protein
VGDEQFVKVVRRLMHVQHQRMVDFLHYAPPAFLFSLSL